MQFKSIISVLFGIILSLGLSGTVTAQEIEIEQNKSHNYIGIGAGNSGLALYSKIHLGDNFSLRPMLVGEFDFDDFEDFEGKVIVPLTYDFSPMYRGASPFVGVGGGSSTDNFDFGWVLTAGVDYPISERFTATGLFNAELFADNEISAIIGLGFNF